MAVDEDVDAVGLSILSGSHVELVKETFQQLAAMGADDVVVFVGGTIPDDDRAALEAIGVKGVFTSEMRLDDVIAAVVSALK